ncbi:MAG: Asp-tRNA(Asn)/Glu-tRNA(Gln) amidotransferase GatCAB subunit B, partial [Tissierellia bacterium]|nr:Asp-tRNA(Asn)/Glu-tRNA(Gln) amidotransferase GatCAB subunit B [Tissierellia bacterium]
EGSLRCDVNINVVDNNSGKKTNITEVKNLNSFSAAVKAMEYEEKRHRELLEKGENTEKETRRWDDGLNETVLMRKKLIATDYRYVPEGDIPPIFVPQEWVDKIKESLPELPDAKKQRFMDEYSLSEYDAKILSSTIEISKFFEEVLKTQNDSKLVANWVIGEVLRILNDKEKEINELSLEPIELSKLLDFIKEDKINNNTGKKVLKEMVDTNKSAEEIIKERGLIQISDESHIKEVVDKVIANNQQSVEDFHNGKDRALGFLVGQVMKEMKGKANPKIVNELVAEALKLQ